MESNKKNSSRLSNVINILYGSEIHSTELCLGFPLTYDGEVVAEIGDWVVKVNLKKSVDDPTQYMPTLLIIPSKDDKADLNSQVMSAFLVAYPGKKITSDPVTKILLDNELRYRELIDYIEFKLPLAESRFEQTFNMSRVIEPIRDSVVISPDFMVRVYAVLMEMEALTEDVILDMEKVIEYQKVALTKENLEMFNRTLEKYNLNF